jgi:hypothetical protein
MGGWTRRIAAAQRWGCLGDAQPTELTSSRPPSLPGFAEREAPSCGSPCRKTMPLAVGLVVGDLLGNERRYQAPTGYPRNAQNAWIVFPACRGYSATESEEPR